MSNLNWTIEVIVTFISLKPLTFAFLITLSQYLKEKYRHNLFMMLSWFLMILVFILVIFANLFLSTFLFLIAAYLFIPTSFFIILVIDSVSRESVDPIKLIIMSVLSTVVIFTSFNQDVVIFFTYPNGDMGLLMGDNFRIANSLFFILISVMNLYYTVRIYKNAPKDLKFYASILLLGGIIAGVGSLTFVGLGLNKIIPGCHILSVAIGGLLMAIAFTKKPKLAYVLPFRVMRLSIIDTKSSISLFNYTWSTGKDLIDDHLFSGMLHGISMFIEEAVSRGNIRGILLDQAILIMKRSEEFHIIFVLVASKSSKILRETLNFFAEKFIAKFSQYLFDIRNVNVFATASNLVKECFPFVPEYD